MTIKDARKSKKKQEELPPFLRLCVPRESPIEPLWWKKEAGQGTPHFQSCQADNNKKKKDWW